MGAFGILGGKALSNSFRGCNRNPNHQWTTTARLLRLSPLPGFLPLSPGSAGWRCSGGWDDTQEEAENVEGGCINSIIMMDYNNNIEYSNNDDNNNKIIWYIVLIIVIIIHHSSSIIHYSSLMSNHSSFIIFMPCAPTSTTHRCHHGFFPGANVRWRSWKRSWSARRKLQRSLRWDGTQGLSWRKCPVHPWKMEILSPNNCTGLVQMNFLLGNF